MINILKIALSLLPIFFFSTPLFAYFDPGTGAFIIQSILAFIAVITVYLGYPYRIIKNFLIKIKNRLKKKKNTE
jgi:hypothetical protein